MEVMLESILASLVAKAEPIAKVTAIQVSMVFAILNALFSFSMH